MEFKGDDIMYQATDGMKFEFRYRSLQAEEQTPIGASRVVDAVSIGNEAAAQATDVQERVPVRTVAGEPRHIDRQDQADFAETDPPHQFFEATATCGGRAAQAKVGVDHIDIRLMPAEFVGALAEGVLKPQAFLIADHLVGRRLADIDDRLARQVSWLDQLGLHERPPPEPRRHPRQSDAAELAAALPTDPSDPCS